MIKYIFIILSCFNLAYGQELTVEINTDSSEIYITEFTVKNINTVSEKDRFIGISKNWTLLLELKYEDVLFQIPIDSNVHSVIIHPNKNASGYCNVISYFNACDVFQISEHGNGCSEMNQVKINTCSDDNITIFLDGKRRSPYFYINEIDISKKEKVKRSKR